MSTIIGILFFIVLSEIFAVTSSTTLVDSGLSAPIAANQTLKLRWWVPFSVGAAGGIKLMVAPPAGATAYLVTINLFDTQGTALIYDILVAPGEFSNAIAAAGNYWMEIEAVITNGDTADTVQLQVAQNSSNATALKLLPGSTLDVIKL